MTLLKRRSPLLDNISAQNPPETSHFPANETQKPPQGLQSPITFTTPSLVSPPPFLPFPLTHFLKAVWIPQGPCSPPLSLLPQAFACAGPGNVASHLAPPVTAQQDPLGKGTAARLSLCPEQKAGLPVCISYCFPSVYPTPACQPGPSPPHTEKEQALYSHFSWQEAQQVCRQQINAQHHLYTNWRRSKGGMERWRPARSQWRRDRNEPRGRAADSERTSMRNRIVTGQEEGTRMVGEGKILGTPAPRAEDQQSESEWNKQTTSY